MDKEMKRQLKVARSRLNYASKAITERVKLDHNKQYLEAIIWHVQDALQMLASIEAKERMNETGN